MCSAEGDSPPPEGGKKESGAVRSEAENMMLALPASL